jgi:hypothetical protein
MYKFHSKLVCFVKAKLLVTNNIKDTNLLQNFAVHYRSVMFYSTGPDLIEFLTNPYL